MVLCTGIITTVMMETYSKCSKKSERQVTFSHIVRVETPVYDYDRRNEDRLNKLWFKHRINKAAEVIEPVLIRKWFTMHLAMEHARKMKEAEAK